MRAHHGRAGPAVGRGTCGDRPQRLRQFRDRRGDRRRQQRGRAVLSVKARDSGNLVGVGGVALRPSPAVYMHVDEAGHQPAPSEVEAIETAARGGRRNPGDTSIFNRDLSGHRSRRRGDPLRSHNQVSDAQPGVGLKIGPRATTGSSRPPSR